MGAAAALALVRDAAPGVLESLLGNVSGEIGRMR